MVEASAAVNTVLSVRWAFNLGVCHKKINRIIFFYDYI